MASASSAAEVSVKRFKASEVHVDKVDDKFIFPVADGECVQPHQDDHLRRVQQRKKAQKEKAEQDAIARAEAESNAADASQPHEPDYWTITTDTLTRHHMTPRLKLFVPTEIELPIPLRFLDVRRTTSTDIDEFKERRIEDLWPEEEQRELSTTWTG